MHKITQFIVIVFILVALIWYFNTKYFYYPIGSETVSENIMEKTPPNSNQLHWRWELDFPLC